MGTHPVAPFLCLLWLLPFSSRPDQCFHMIQVRFQRPPASSGQFVLRFRHTAFKVLLARKVLPFLELSRVHAQVSIGCMQELLEFVECHCLVYGKSTDNAQSDRLVNQTIQTRCTALGRPRTSLLWPGVCFCFAVPSHRTS
jgi:hypothetical protein